MEASTTVRSAAGAVIGRGRSRRRPATARVDRATRPSDQRALPQLSLGGVFAVWAAAALPMAVLAWVVAPAIADGMSGSDTMPRALIISLAAGLVWQFVLVMGLVHREQGSIRWSVLKDALWLRAPRAPSTGKRGGKLWFVLIPLTVAFAAEEMMPGIAPMGGHDMLAFLDSSSGHSLLHGSVVWFAILTTLTMFNTVLGEELLFRGYLLPRMNGVFGRGDWFANGLLFAAYHLHMPWAIPTTLLDTFILSYPSKRYRSALIGIAVHSAQSVVLLGLVTAVFIGG